MARALVSLALASVVIAPGCTSTQAPIARRVGMVASIGGVIGLTAGAAASSVADTHEIVAVFSLISAIGIGLYAAGELTDPRFEVQAETTLEKHRRWARILTERAFRYAREGNCRRVRRVEKRVNVYDRDLHDGVFLRDEAIARCMSAATDPPPAAPPLPAAAGEPASTGEPGQAPLPPPPLLPPASSVRDPADTP